MQSDKSVQFCVVKLSGNSLIFIHCLKLRLVSISSEFCLHFTRHLPPEKPSIGSWCKRVSANLSYVHMSPTPRFRKMREKDIHKYFLLSISPINEDPLDGKLCVFVDVEKNIRISFTLGKFCSYMEHFRTKENKHNTFPFSMKISNWKTTYI